MTGKAFVEEARTSFESARHSFRDIHWEVLPTNRILLGLAFVRHGG